MNREQYLHQSEVQQFIDWSNEYCAPNGFSHSYYSLKPRGHWQCHSLYNAFEVYSWGFSSFDPVSGNSVTGKTYLESSDYLKGLSAGLQESVTLQDDEKAIAYCRAIMKWGGVLRRNEDALKRFIAGSTMTMKLLEAREKLHPQKFTLSDDTGTLFINSGFSKIYSLLIDDFVIYDSRVGAALGLLVRKFCEENGIVTIPKSLRFAYADAPPAKGHGGGRNVRDPGTEHYKFPKLANDKERYIHNNMKANWLIKAIAHHPDNAFSELPLQERMRALEAALFMVGYKVW